ncbi:MAG: DUF2244 domain-containing protein [Gammaproteobacteria bacterium]|nr:DUF2244 domain-containing protein [Gammaproteobacteria bacterium]MDE2023553.1 DUF2244 domain-containing protein [Gammaproteobacteria bacterium]MDE2140127.1 DUF2244 domain-containing protein [Gammaproteobacteria bacterium]
MLAVNPDAATHRIVIVPNCSISATGLWLFYASIVGVTLALASWYALHGFWPVLAFAVLEMLVLGLCLRVCWRHAHYGEIITVNGAQVAVDKCGSRHLEHREFSRYWAQVVVRDSGAKLHPARLFIRSHGEECEIGSCLTEEERRSLVRRLAELIGPVGQIGGR